MTDLENHRFEYKSEDSSATKFNVFLLDVEFSLIRKVINSRTLSLFFFVRKLSTMGRAIAQAVSRRLPTAAARVQTRVWSCGIL
jgi:hypothetical protein